jgi:hypothetical protein
VRRGRSRPLGIDTFEPPSIASGGLEALIFKASELVSQVLLVVLTGRLLGPSGRGLYALASLSVGICQVPFGSVWIANAVELARKRATPREIFGVSVVVAAAGGGITCLVALAISPLLGDRWWVLALPSLITAFVLLRAYQEGIWQAVGHVRAVNVLRLGRACLPFLFTSRRSSPTRRCARRSAAGCSRSSCSRSPPGSAFGRSSARRSTRASSASTAASRSTG